VIVWLKQVVATFLLFPFFKLAPALIPIFFSLRTLVWGEWQVIGSLTSSAARVALSGAELCAPCHRVNERSQIPPNHRHPRFESLLRFPYIELTILIFNGWLLYSSSELPRHARSDFVNCVASFACLMPATIFNFYGDFRTALIQWF
jgi:hypothetical protein